MTIGQKIKAARKSANMTQADLAKKLGISYQGVAQWESDKRNPKWETLQRIADALNVPISTLTEDIDTIKIPMPDYATRIPSEDEFARMNPIEQERYSLRVLADISPELLKQRLDDRYQKMNILGKVEAVIRLSELAELSKFIDPDPNNVPLTIAIERIDPNKKPPQD